MAKGILIAAMDFSTVAEDEFHDWYDLEHVPERLRVPGFNNAERWIGIQNPKVSVATYDLDSLGVLKSPPYLAVAHDKGSPWSMRLTSRVKRLIRYEGDQIVPGGATAPAGATGMLMIAMNVAPEHEADFNDWYNKEHIPALSAVPGTLSARRFQGNIAGTRRYVALYHFNSPDVPSTDAWKKGAASPWTERLRPHFRDFLRIDCRRYSRAK
ncbi:MAG: hypothetical protein EXQ87_05040 [Alphaproteobacteria bacterium]|nr:hypothetical protein [Alphaproteobacteria bacterium]